MLATNLAVAAAARASTAGATAATIAARRLPVNDLAPLTAPPYAAAKTNMPNGAASSSSSLLLSGSTGSTVCASTALACALAAFEKLDLRQRPLAEALAQKALVASALVVVVVVGIGCISGIGSGVARLVGTACRLDSCGVCAC